MPPEASSGSVLLEACVESLSEAVGAAGAGARRLEVCAAMIEGGTTPSIGLVEEVLASGSLPAFVMIRPRGGDFAYDDGEVRVMLRDIAAVRRAGAHGIVSGALDRFNMIDLDVTRRLVEAAAPLPFTFHRAIDLTPSVEHSVDLLRAAGVTRVLTSGGASSALVGADVIAGLVRRAGTGLMIVAGGGVRAENVVQLVQRTRVREVHARPTRLHAGASAGAREVRFGPRVFAADREVLDADGIRALASVLAAS